MKTATRLLTIAAVALALGGCKKKDKEDSDVPGGSGANPAQSAVTNPTLATKAAKEDFHKVVAKYNDAKADGSLSKDECERLSKQFHRVYKSHGEQMAVAWFNAGAVWEECGERKKAEEVYAKMTREVPKYDLSHNNLGVMYRNRGEDSRAFSYFERAVKANPKTRAPRNNLAASLRDRYTQKPGQGDFDKAEREIQTVLAVDSGNKLAYENLARLYYDRGRLKDTSYLLLANLVVSQALRVLDKENKKSADINNLKGLLLMEEDNLIEALKWFKKAADVDGQHADANINIALISIRFRDYEQAEKSLKIALKDGRQKRNNEAYLGLGVAQRGLRKYKEAEAAFKKASKLKKGDPRPNYNLGILYQEHIAANEENFEVGKKHYNTAKSFFNKFMSQAGASKDFAGNVTDAKLRVANIDQLFKDIAEMKELEKKAKELEAQQKKLEAIERKQLLEAEEDAIKRATEAAAKAAAEASKKKEAPKKEDKSKKDKKK